MCFQLEGGLVSIDNHLTLSCMVTVGGVLPTWRVDWFLFDNHLTFSCMVTAYRWWCASNLKGGLVSIDNHLTLSCMVTAYRWWCASNLKGGLVSIRGYALTYT